MLKPPHCFLQVSDVAEEQRCESSNESTISTIKHHAPHRANQHANSSTSSVTEPAGTTRPIRRSTEPT